MMQLTEKNIKKKLFNLSWIDINLRKSKDPLLKIIAKGSVKGVKIPGGSVLLLKKGRREC